MLFQPSGHFSVIREENFAHEMKNVEQILQNHVTTGYFTSFDDARLYYEYFLVENPKASIVFVHGYTEFCKKYYELVWYFMNMGYNVFIYDQRGHGFSHRDVEDFQVIHVNRFEDYADDLDCFVEKVVLTVQKDVPLYLYAHSMGGAVAAFYLAKVKNKIQKTVLSAPMIYPVCTSLPRQLLRFLIKKEAKKKGWKTRLRFSRDFNPDAQFERSGDLSEGRFRYNLQARIEEPRYQNSCSSNRWNYETLGVLPKMFRRANIKNMHSDILIVSAENDTVVEVKPQKKLAKRLKCRYLCVKDAKHCLYTQNDEALVAFLDKILAFYGV
ncbi:MAG: alpha/beta hydrolase [Clostridia bacterium]|nr:alpha/beta hydrolase [Clostridia bacterium]